MRRSCPESPEFIHGEIQFGAWLVWDDLKQVLVYRPLKSLFATPDDLKTELPTLAEHESLAIDLHSHGHSSAFFSPKDNTDDQGEVKVSGVYGSIGTEAPDSVFRICTGGIFININ